MSKTYAVRHNPLYDLIADSYGLQSIPSGTCPNVPGETRLLLQNCALQEGERVSQEVQDTIARLAEEGDEDGLKDYLNAAFPRVGRAETAEWH